MNTIIIMGRLTRDPEIRYSKDSKAIARVSIAVDRRFKQEGQPEADFFNLVGFGKTADFIGECCSESRGCGSETYDGCQSAD